MRRSIVVAIRGWTTSGDRLLAGRPGGEFPSETLRALAAGLPVTEVWAPDLDLSMFTMRQAEDVANELYDKVCAKLDTMPDVEQIVLLGYSAGSLLARRLFCKAHGAEQNGNVDPSRVVWWAPRVHRLVVLAGITRGWEFSTASPDHVRFLSPLLLGVAKAVGWWKGLGAAPGREAPFIWQLKRGSPFVISTRIQYVKVMARLRSSEHAMSSHALRSSGLPTTIFLLGARDEYISPSDCTELGPREEFAYAELNGSNHTEVLLLSGADAASTARRIRILAVLSLGFDELCGNKWVLPADDIDDYLDPMDLSETQSNEADEADLVEHAVMVVHGIRDNGFWTKRVGRELKTQGRQSALHVRAPSPSYGFFSMWDFVKPNGRMKATYWFMERYADVRSRFPNAAISFVGHSNGTYIAARAMELCPAIRFKRVVFAGSVVRRNYEWSERGGQVQGMLNYVGNADGVVAFLPAVFEFLHLRWLDVGGAGAFGFRAAEPGPAVRKCVTPSGVAALELTELKYVEGGHGAAIGEDFWPEIAAFVLHGQLPERKAVSRVRRVSALFRCAPVLTLTVLAAAVGLMALPLWVVVGLVLTAQQAFALMHPGLWSLGAVVVVAGSMGVSWLAGQFLRAW